ncbi:MAG: SUMF1/EgtB/PvdO family nonheme iron enzyme [Pirellulales bacterium]|nr:SUMF1/EgtB/PvdO family nonheme iron enzyme [Pirellulales bacterium]
MTPNRPRDCDSLETSLLEQIDRLCDRFETMWKSGERPRIEAFLTDVSEQGRPVLLHDLLLLELDYRRRRGETPEPSEYQSRFADAGDLIEQVFAEATPRGSTTETTDWRAAASGGPAAVEMREPAPGEKVGRYELREMLGKGGFGMVFLGHDADLDRPVAIKFLDAKRFSSQHAFETLQSEARTLAKLRHPAIVAVHDVGRDEAGRCYMVMEYVPGRSLKQWAECQRLALRPAVTGIATVAEAVYHAHTQGLVHRDLKPNNILVDAKGSFYVADFGLAVYSDTQRWLAGEIGGTPAYMAPEQVRGETHRLDGRTDVWSLGVVLYELLTLRRPFAGRNAEELFAQVQYRQPAPLRQIDGSIPYELERICLKCLSKRMTDRYSTAMELANDLHHWMQTHERGSAGGSRQEHLVDAAGGSFSDRRLADLRTGSSVSPAASSASYAGPWSPVKIVPKGLRSFSAEDKDFFLELLAGPRDRDGLPENVRFWKSRIEDPDGGFSCGLIYGPSGCGKSSLVKAGLLPRLAEHVVPVYVEAVADATEPRLWRELRKACPHVPDGLNLAQAIASLRAERIAWPDRKVLIVLDQFEQWLHAHHAHENTELVDALRQCDGQRLQCLILVRDDFWLAVTRFLHALEVQLIEERNIALVDLFDPRHAKRVLTEFGQAFGCLPEARGETTAEQRAFLDRAVAGLVRDDKVVPVRLSLFAEMVKNRPWTPATLRRVGGLEGLGVAFLEESFGARTANPQHRFHQQAARAVLQGLLPDHTADIKGRMCSYGELLEVSGYAQRPADFDELLRILDADLRLITPTDPEGREQSGPNPALERSDERYYQLSHDYVILPLRQWLTQKQRESWRGRARLCLQQRTAQWQRTRDRRFLPSPLEYLRIRAAVPGRQQRPEEREVVRAATRRYGTTALVLAVLLAILGWATWEANGRIQGRRLGQAILAAAPSELGKLIDEDLPLYRRWVNPRLRVVAADTAAGSQERLRAALALLPSDESLADDLGRRLLDGDFAFFSLIRDSLKPHGAGWVPSFWDVLRDPVQDPAVRFRAGMALAEYVPESPKWSAEDAEFLAASLLRANADDQRTLRDYLRPLRPRLLGPLEAVFRDADQTETIRSAAATALADFAADRPRQLVELAADALAPQYEVLFSALAGPAPHHHAAHARLRQILDRPPAAIGSPDRATLARRRAGAAVTLIRLGMPAEAMRIFQGCEEDREAVTQFIHGLKARGVRAADLLACLDLAKDEISRYSLLLALGEFDLRRDFLDSQRESLLKTLVDWHRGAPESAVHGACQWLLHEWELTHEMAAADETPLEPDPTGRRTWFRQKLGGEWTTLVVFRPGTFTMGSPESEEDHQLDERLHEAEIARPFAMADREVTRRQFEAYLQREGRALAKIADEFSPTAEHAMMGVYWLDAVMFCRWLTEQAGMSEDDQCYAVQEFRLSPQGAVRYPARMECRLDRPGFRLPTEREWEYACRCGTRTDYSFGADRTLLGAYAWYFGNSGGRTRPPDRLLRPNPRGLFDMHGNAYEWCHDVYGDYPEDLTRDWFDGLHVLRGGGWCFYELECRSAYRSRKDLPTRGLSSYGLRVVQTLPASPAGR